MDGPQNYGFHPHAYGSQLNTVSNSVPGLSTDITCPVVSRNMIQESLAIPGLTDPMMYVQGVHGNDGNTDPMIYSQNVQGTYILFHNKAQSVPSNVFQGFDKQDYNAPPSSMCPPQYQSNLNL